MKAIVQDRYGSADVLELRDVEDPVVGEKDVLLGVQSPVGSSWASDQAYREAAGPSFHQANPLTNDAADKSQPLWLGLLANTLQTSRT
jgi:hypothetical protein